MATLALGLAAPALGNAILGGYGLVLTGVGSAIVGAAGSLVGSYIDARYIFPPKGASSTGVDEFALSLASEGTPMPRPWGTNVRVPGTVIWVSPVISAAVTGGSTKSGKITNKNYYASIAVAIGDGQHHSTSPRQIWADGQLIYDINGIDLSNTSNLLSVIPKKWSSTTVNRMEIQSAAGGPDLTQYKTGKNATTSGFTNGGNNVTGQVLQTGTIGTATYLHIASTTAVTEAAGANATIDETLSAFDSSRLTSITKYAGSTTQTADTIIVSFEGSGNVPAFRDTHYVVLERVYLGPFGNRIPQFQCLARKDTTQSLGLIVGSLLEAAGLSSSDYDVSPLTENPIGCAQPGPEPAGDSVSRLMTAFNVIVQEVGGKLRFFYRTAPTEVTAREADLAAHAYGEDAPRPVEFSDARDLELPSEVHVAYQDASKDYQRGVQVYRRVDSTQRTVRLVDLFSAPVARTSPYALAIAKRALWTAHVNRVTARVQLPPSMWHLAENDVLVVPADGETYRLLVMQANRGANGVVAVDAMVEQAQAVA